MALVYRAIGQLDQALALYEQALSIRREVGDRVGEAITLNNIGEVYKATGQPQRALEICEKALSLTRQGGDRAGEATVLYNMASLLYRYLNQTEGAIVYVEQAITVMQETGLSHDAAGDSLEDLQQTLYFMRTGASL
jgi:tetratricopeptide (TPR) repeat protein